ncbi:hypothetical protein TWF106_003533 [Orbilia oligospora]|uniref:Uncharacterized protein n=1 Tax=Orbilia oligospora TaxID=2813651 RepID=A0A7C8UIM2_ORBOL|nr:hypothetical protein TWF106_003533 [Orbilia oligospora]KAF3217753.1 hypothetical protein TWF679_001953 [Orbilia oligospora]
MTGPTITVPTANFAVPYFFDYDPTGVGLVAELHVRLYIQHGSQDSSAQNFAAATDRFNVGGTSLYPKTFSKFKNGFTKTRLASIQSTPLRNIIYRLGGNDRASCKAQKMQIGKPKDPSLRDSALILLVLSCRLRVSSIYRAILSEAQDVFHKGELVSSTTKRHASSSVHIGGLDWQASPKLQAIIILQAMEYFLTSFQTGDLDKTAEIKQGIARSEHIAQITTSAVKESEVETLLAIRRIKCLL